MKALGKVQLCLSLARALAYLALVVESSHAAGEVKERASLKGHKASVWSVAIDRYGKILASGDSEGTIRLWDISTGKETITFNGGSLRG